MMTLIELIQRDIQAIASIYPTAFNLYDDPLARLSQRIEASIRNESAYPKLVEALKLLLADYELAVGDGFLGNPETEFAREALKEAGEI